MDNIQIFCLGFLLQAIGGSLKLTDEGYRNKTLQRKLLKSNAIVSVLFRIEVRSSKEL